MAASSESLPSAEITRMRASTTVPAAGAARRTSGEVSTEVCIDGSGADCVTFGCTGPRDSTGCGIFGAVLSPHPAVANASVTAPLHPTNPIRARRRRPTIRPMTHLARSPVNTARRAGTAADLVSTRPARDNETEPSALGHEGHSEDSLIQEGPPASEKAHGAKPEK